METGQQNQPKTYILAVSGGPDSMYLLDTQARLRDLDSRCLVVAHVDYGLRKSSANDAEFVQEMAMSRGIPCEVHTVSEQERSAQGGNLEAWARDVRYAFFEDVRTRYEADAVLTGHNANDQAETVLMRMLQGTGLRGLAGMRTERGTVMRPLLATTRLEILSFLESHDILFRTDETNADTTLLRNKIRHEILPRLERADGTAVQKLNELALVAQEAVEDMEQVCQTWLVRYSQELLGEQVLHLPSFLQLPSHVQHEVVRTISGLRGRDGKEEQELVRFLHEAKTGSQKPLSSGLNVKKYRATVAFTSASGSAQKAPVTTPQLLTHERPQSQPRREAREAIRTGQGSFVDGLSRATQRAKAANQPR